MITLDGNADTTMDFARANRTLDKPCKRNNKSEEIHATTNYL